MKTTLSRCADFMRPIMPGGVFSFVRRLGTAFLTPIRFSWVSGHFRSSLKSRAEDCSGAAVPWYTYPAIDLLKQREFSSRSVLEFGGGQSTRWWVQRAARVMTIEPDADWAAELKATLASAADVHHVPVDRATRSVDGIVEILRETGVSKFDIIVIDGHLRGEMMQLCAGMLSDDGALIFDNSERYGFSDLVAELGLQHVDFYGFAPGVHSRSCTSIAFHDRYFLFDPSVRVIEFEA